MKRILSPLLLTLLLGLALPATTSAAGPSLSLTCAPAAANASIVCRLAGRGFVQAERLKIAYRVTLSGGDPVQSWTRTATAAANGSLSRPPLAFTVRSGQTYRVSATVTGTKGSRAIVSAAGRYTEAQAKRLVISVSRQRMFAYAGNRLVYTSLVTTGNSSLPTPLGTYRIFAKYHPYQFVSPWPIGSPYWYASAWSNYAMQFRGDGYFIHDAPWRSVFGPGSNGAGQPGTNYGGTHGCVNAPVPAAQFVYGWAPIGTRLEVVQ